MSSNRHGKDDDSKMICLKELLSSCVDASLRGCEVIRQHYDKNNGDNSTGAVLKEAGEIKSVVTQADIDAQKVIVEGLRELWGNNLHIIGEEDDDEDGAPNSDMKGDNHYHRSRPLRTDLLPKKDLCDGSSNNTMLLHIPLTDITIFVDPLDGTREFVEGRVQNVGCLIGVANKEGKAICGAIGLPFPGGKEQQADAGPLVHYAISLSCDDGSGCQKEFYHRGFFPPHGDNNEDKDKDKDKDNGHKSPILTIYTGDSNNPILVNATDCAKCLSKKLSLSPNHVLLGGTAAKLMAVAASQQPTHNDASSSSSSKSNSNNNNIGSSSMAVLHFKTCLWDTCAPEALLHANGGKVTDFFGSPLIHSRTNKYNHGNIWGVIASSGELASQIHDELCATMRKNVKSIQASLGREDTKQFPLPFDSDDAVDET